MSKRIKFNRQMQMRYAQTIQWSSRDDIILQTIELCEFFHWDKTPGTWGYFFQAWLDFLLDDTARAPFKIFGKGNGKLPFFHFSALPVVTCPGAGVCAGFCYSFKAWRYPCPFLRQVQNTYLLKFRPELITLAFNALPHGTTVRLYVDGDIDSIHTLRYWLDNLKRRADLSAYGYSKSWALFIALDDMGYDWPANYLLNLSSGGNGTPTMLGRIKRLPIVRGQFLALDAGKDGAHYQGNSTEYRAAVRQAARASGIERLFVCPGNCGSCTKNGHACGLESFKTITIGIGIHA